MIFNLLEKYRKLDFLEISHVFEKIREFSILLKNSKNCLKILSDNLILVL